MHWKYYFPLFGPLFTLLMVAFHEQKLLVLIYSSLSKFSLMVSVLLSYFIKSLPISNSDGHSLNVLVYKHTESILCMMWRDKIHILKIWLFNWPSIFMKRTIFSSWLFRVTFLINQVNAYLWVCSVISTLSHHMIRFRKNKELLPLLPVNALEQICTIRITLFSAEHA